MIGGVSFSNNDEFHFVSIVIIDDGINDSIQNGQQQDSF